MSRIPSAAAPVAVAAALASPFVGPLDGRAHANVFIAVNSATNYSYIVHKVPDFDQRRIGLLENGDFYCVPTSALNWFAYIANHGYPNLNPGTGDWSQQSRFQTVTNDLVALGVLMNTNPATGTNLSGAVNGASAWLGGSPYLGQFVVIGKNTSSSKSYRFDDLAQHALGGSLVMPRIGWYDMVNYPIMIRDGGHLTSMTRANRSGSNRIIGFNDPGTDNGLLGIQSDFTREDYSVSDEWVVVGGTPRQMSRVWSYLAQGRGGWIDGYRAIVPLFGLTRSPDGTSLIKNNPFAFGDLPPSQATFPTGGTINHLKISSDALSAIIASNNTQQGIWSIKKADLVTGEVDTLVSFGQTVSQIATGRFGDIFILQAGAQTLSRFTPGQPKPTSIQIPESMSAIVYDDFTDKVVLFAAQTRRLYRYPWNFVQGDVPPQPEIYQLPNHLPNDGLRYLAISPVTGDVWYTTSNSLNFWQIVIPGDGSVLVNEIAAGPTSISSRDLTIDDAGYIYHCNFGADIIQVYAPHRPGDDFVTLLGPDDHPLAHMPCNQRFAIVTSRHNFDPTTENDPTEWDIVLPTGFTPSIPGCPADLNGDGVVDGVDLGLLLSVWGATGFAPADLNSDGLVDGVDLGILLTLWGPCPGPGD